MSDSDYSFDYADDYDDDDDDLNIDIENQYYDSKGRPSSFGI